MSSTWESLSKEERIDLYTRRYEDKEPVDSLSVQTGIPSVTLNRRLQELRREIEGDDDEIPSGERVSYGFDDPNNMWMSFEGESSQDENGGVRVKSLKDLLVSCNVDLDEWNVSDYLVNTWEGFRKAQTKSLIFDEGVISGSVQDTGGFVTVTMYQVKAKLLRKKPVEVVPVIKPVVIEGLKHRDVWGSSSRKGVKKTLVIPDIHAGFRRDMVTGKLEPLHDREALSIILSVVSGHILFDEIVILGDLFDLPDWSDKFIQSPEFYQVTQPALEEMAWFLAKIRAAQPTAKIYVIEGNHEKRLRDSIIRHVPQAYGIRPVNAALDYNAWSLPILMDFKSLDIIWIGDYPDGIVWLEEDLACVHGLELSAEKAANNSTVSIIFGHIHRYEASSRAIYSGKGMKNVFTHCPGFLGRLDGIIPGNKSRQRWSSGFSIVFHAENMYPQVQHIPITNGKALVGLDKYEGYDYRSQLLTELNRGWQY